jgi:5-methyltetrahydrofolate--homocysteine methyltransferase
MRMIIIGENIHCSRVVKAGGPRCAKLADGSLRVTWEESGTGAASFAVPAALAGAKVKHVIAALQVARGGGAESAAAQAYFVWLARQQELAGAHYLDVNVDEYSLDKETNAEAMRWLAGFLAGQTRLPVALDSSAVGVLQAGIEAAPAAGPQWLLNSASMERLDVLDLAAATGAAVLCSGAGAAVLPQTAAERVAALEPVVAAARERGLPPDRLFLDPLVLPIGMDPLQGMAFLDACRELRHRHGPTLHVVGGISNVSYGMPERRLLNHRFLQLAMAAGLDAAIYDPLQLAPGTWTPELAAAADRVLTGDDAFAADFLALVRGAT